MTISKLTRKAIVAGNGVLTSFNFSFQVRSAADLQVYYTDADGNITLLASNLYSVVLDAVPTGQLWSGGGSVTYAPSSIAIASGTSLTIARTVALLQSSSFINQGGYYPQTVEQSVDLLTMEMQQLSETQDRALTIPISSTASAALPTPTASGIFAWNVTADEVEYISVASIGAITIPVPVAQGGTAGTTAATGRAGLNAQRQPCVTMIRTANSTNDTVTSAAWKVYTETGAELNTVGTTTEGLQEAINYASRYGYDLEVFGSGVIPNHWGVPYGGALGNNPFATTNLSAVVIVTQASHGRTTGDKMTFNGLSGAINGIAVATFAAEHAITVINANSYSVTLTAANATSSGGGANCRFQDSGQNASIINCTTGITVPPIQGVKWRIHATINFGGASTVGIQFDSMMLSDIEFSDQIVCSAPYLVGVKFAPSGELPQDPNGPVCTSSNVRLCPIVMAAPTGVCVQMDCTSGTISDSVYQFLELNAGAIGLQVVFSATYGCLGNKVVVNGAHSQTSFIAQIGTSATGAANNYSNVWDIQGHPATGGAGLDIWGTGDIYHASIDNAQGTPTTGVTLESSATGNIIVSAKNGATTALSDSSTAKDNVYISGTAVSSGASTITLTNNLTETRAVGAAAAGAVSGQSFNTTFTGDAGGTTNLRGYVYAVTGSGTNAAAGLTASRIAPTWAGTGVALTTLLGEFMFPTVSGTGNATTVLGYNVQHQLSSSGGAPTATGYLVTAPILSSTGAIGTLTGFSTANLGHASLVTNAIGFGAADMTASLTLTAGFRGQVTSGTNKYNLYMDGTAQNFLQGVTGIGIAAAASTQLNLPAGTTAISSMRLAHGAAPTSPVNGDMWTTTSGLFVRINGGTVGPLT